MNHVALILAVVIIVALGSHVVTDNDIVTRKTQPAVGTVTKKVAHVAQNDTVVVFTAWKEFKNVTHFKPRIDHHIDYTTFHGYRYVIFVAVDISVEDKNILGEGVEVIVVPGFGNRRDSQKERKPLQAGWLKIEGFKILHSLASTAKPALFFYIDMDVVFHNFIIPLGNVFHGRPQSIFVQDRQADRMFSPSHAVAMRNTPAALSFVEDWAGLLPECPHLNMEQGAYMLAISRFLNNCTGSTVISCKTRCESLCTSKKIHTGRNNKFYDCTSRFLGALEARQGGGVYDHSALLIFRQVKKGHRAPQDGFTLQAGPDVDLTGSCPLTVHPDKSYHLTVRPSYRECRDVPLTLRVKR